MVEERTGFDRIAVQQGPVLLGVGDVDPLREEGVLDIREEGRAEAGSRSRMAVTAIAGNSESNFQPSRRSRNDGSKGCPLALATSSQWWLKYPAISSSSSRA